MALFDLVASLFVPLQAVRLGETTSGPRACRESSVMTMGEVGGGLPSGGGSFPGIFSSSNFKDTLRKTNSSPLKIGLPN